MLCRTRCVNLRLTLSRKEAADMARYRAVEAAPPGRRRYRFGAAASHGLFRTSAISPDDGSRCRAPGLYHLFGYEHCSVMRSGCGSVHYLQADSIFGNRSCITGRCRAANRATLRVTNDGRFYDSPTVGRRKVPSRTAQWRVRQWTTVWAWRSHPVRIGPAPARGPFHPVFESPASWRPVINHPREQPLLDRHGVLGGNREGVALLDD